MNAMDVGKRLVEYCKAGENRKAIEELYADNAVSVEVMDGGPDWPREHKGKDVILRSSDQWYEMFEVHGGTIDGPYPHDDEFIVFMSVDVTGRTGPMEGKRMQMKEAGRYTVKDGKITEARYYYDMPGGDC